MEILSAIYENAKNEKIDELLGSAKTAIVNAIKATGRSSLYLKNKTSEEWYYYDNFNDLIVTNYLNKIISNSDFTDILKSDPFFKGWLVKYVGDDLILIEKE